MVELNNEPIDDRGVLLRFGDLSAMTDLQQRKSIIDKQKAIFLDIAAFEPRSLPFNDALAKHDEVFCKWWKNEKETFIKDIQAWKNGTISEKDFFELYGLSEKLTRNGFSEMCKKEPYESQYLMDLYNLQSGISATVTHLGTGKITKSKTKEQKQSEFIESYQNGRPFKFLEWKRDFMNIKYLGFWSHIFDLGITIKQFNYKFDTPLDELEHLEQMTSFYIDLVEIKDKAMNLEGFELWEFKKDAESICKSKYYDCREIVEIEINKLWEKLVIDSDDEPVTIAEKKAKDDLRTRTMLLLDLGILEALKGKGINENPKGIIEISRQAFVIRRILGVDTFATSTTESHINDWKNDKLNEEYIKDNFKFFNEVPRNIKGQKK
jgi:hypothetical protein